MLELDLQHQGQERAEDVAANGLVELVEDRPRDEQVLDGAEGLLDDPELLVAQRGSQRAEIGVGTQYENAIELRVLLVRQPSKAMSNRTQLIADGPERNAITWFGEGQGALRVAFPD